MAPRTLAGYQVRIRARPTMPVFRLPQEHFFPSPDFADPDGLLAVGGDLHPSRLLRAYTMGIFPWYSEGEPILWWSPAPRLVLLPEEFHVPRRLARTIRQGLFTVTADTAFDAVIAACASTPKRQADGTWITTEMEEAYRRLHRLGFAHSIEAWHQGRLCGGLYGVCLDQVFFGESMFTEVSGGSKVCLATLVDYAKESDIRMIDCQMTTEHLLRFGAREVERQAFQDLLSLYVTEAKPQKKWRLRR